jgi:hypothetical protein
MQSKRKTPVVVILNFTNKADLNFAFMKDIDDALVFVI